MWARILDPKRHRVPPPPGKTDMDIHYETHVDVVVPDEETVEGEGIYDTVKEYVRSIDKSLRDHGMKLNKISNRTCKYIGIIKGGNQRVRNIINEAVREPTDFRCVRCIRVSSKEVAREGDDGIMKAVLGFETMDFYAPSTDSFTGFNSNR